MVAISRPSRPTRYVLATSYAAYVLVASVGAVGPAGLEASRPLGLVGTDLWLHGTTYATLAILLAWAGSVRHTVGLVVVVGVTAGYGGAIELVQASLAHRSFEAVDMAANLVGAAAGVGLWWGLTQWGSGS